MKIFLFCIAILLHALPVIAEPTSKTLKVKVGNCGECSFTSIQKAIEYVIENQDQSHITSQIDLAPGVFRENINLDNIYIGILSIVGSVDSSGKPNSFIIGSISEAPSIKYSAGKLLLLKNIDITTERSVGLSAIVANTLLLSNIKVHNSAVGLTLNSKNGSLAVIGKLDDSASTTYKSCADSFATLDCIDYAQYPPSALFENNDIAIDEDLDYVKSSGSYKYELDNFTFLKNKVGVRMEKWEAGSNSSLSRFVKNSSFTNNKTAIFYTMSSKFSSNINLLKSNFTGNSTALNIPNLTFANPGMKNLFKSNKIAILVREKFKGYSNKKKYFGKFTANKVDLQYRQ